MTEREQDFFRFANERHAVYLARTSGQPWPWTQDPIIQRYRFTNVFRELDATTLWISKNVRNNTRYLDREKMLAVVTARWFNRVRTCEGIFCQLHDYGRGAQTAFGHFLDTGDTAAMRWAARQYCGSGPYVTGAFIIKSPDGYSKLDGVLMSCQWFWERKNPLQDLGKLGWREMSEYLLENRGNVSLELVWEWIIQFPFMGGFMGYEVVSDLRWTHLLDQAPDIMTWANPGPGARRGLNRIYGRTLTLQAPAYVTNAEMYSLLQRSRELGWRSLYPDLEMRDVEHTLCEFDKYERVRLGEGRPRGVFRVPGHRT